MEWICIHGKMIGSVLLELALEVVKNKKNLPFCHCLFILSVVFTQDIIELIGLKIRQGFILWQLESVKAYLNRVIFHFGIYGVSGPSLLIESTDSMMKCSIIPYFF